MCSLCWKLCHRQCNGGKDQDGSPRVVQRSVLPQKLFHRWDNKTSQILHAFPQASGSGHSDLKRVSSDLLLFYAFHMPDAEEMEFESGWAPKPRTLDSSRWCCAPEQASLNVRTWDLKASSARHFVKTSPCENKSMALSTDNAYCLFGILSNFLRSSHISYMAYRLNYRKDETNSKYISVHIKFIGFTSLLALLHGPRWHNFVRMLSCVMGCKGIPCLEGSLTDNTEVGHVKVNLCMSLSCLFPQKGLVAAEAEELSVMSSRYHFIHKRIQVRCEQSIRSNLWN